MVTSDLAYEVTSFNAVAEQVFGRRASETIGKPMPEIICAREFSSACFAIFLEVRNQRLEWEGEMTARRGDGELFQTKVRITPIEDTTGQMIGLQAVGKDLSEQEIRQTPRVEFAEYLVRECNLSPSTAWTYEQGLLRLERFTKKDATEIAVDDVRRFMRDTDYHPSTQSGALVALKAFHKWGALEGYWKLNGIMALRSPRQRRDPKPALIPEEALKLIDACRRPNDFRLIYLGLFAGLRVSDSARITEGEWLPDRLRFAMQKGHKPIDIPVHEELFRVRGKILDNETSRGTLKQVARSLSYYTGVGFTSHTLRRTFATTLIEEGVQEGVVEALLGHSPSSVLRARYAQVTFKEKVAAVERLRYEKPVAGSS